MAEYQNGQVLVSGYRWTGNAVSFSFPTAVPEYYAPNSVHASGFRAFSDQWQQAVREILGKISEVVNLDFVEAEEGHGDIVFGIANIAPNLAGSAFYPNGTDRGGDVWISGTSAHFYNADGTLAPMVAGSFAYRVLIHEILHGLGLEHPEIYPGEGGSSPHLSEAESTTAYTQMAYDQHANLAVHPSELQLYDISALQMIYGARDARLGDDMYDGSSIAMASLWDSGGVDTITAENTNEDAVIDLRQGYFSSIAGVAAPKAGVTSTNLNNVSVAFGSVIENARGGGGNDLIIGNSIANLLQGGGGSDALDGGLGADRLEGALGDDVYFVDNAGDVVVEIAGEGTDTVHTSLALFTLASAVEGLVYTGTAAFTGHGNELDNNIIGGAGADTLNGLAGADRLEGGTGNDRYYVDNSGDMVVELVGAGIDTVYTTLSAHTLADNVDNLTFTSIGAFFGTGNGINNAITGGAGNDILIGGGGSDTLNGSTGADRMEGGIGNDQYYVSQAGDTVVEQAGEGTDTVRTTLGTYGLGADVENLIFTGSIGFTGTGNELNNSITSGTGADLLLGGAGNDILNGGAGVDRMEGGTGNDQYHVDHVDDVIIELANEGVDAIRTSLASFTLADTLETLIFNGTGNFVGIGNDAANSMLGGAGSDQLYGGNGADTLDGGAGADRLEGGTGNDSYVVDNVADVVVELAGEGIDLVRTNLALYTLADALENLTYNGAGGFSGFGNQFANILTGAAGDDVLDGGAGADRLLGGAGNDHYHVDTLVDVVVETAGAGTDTIVTSLASYALSGQVENLVFTGASAFAGTGNSLDNLIAGGSMNDLLIGGVGDDHLIGGAGEDRLEGGAGNDQFEIDSRADVVVEAAGGGLDTVRTTLLTYALVANLEQLTFIGTGEFAGYGNEADNVLRGGSDNDLLVAGAGADMLAGGAGADRLEGGVGDDIYEADDRNDLVVELAGAGTDTVRATVAIFELAAHVENLAYTGTGAFAGVGNELDNVITGGDHNDLLDGAAGADRLDGGNGNDTYHIDDADDVVVESLGGGHDTIKTTLSSFALGAAIENLAFTGSGAFTATGNSLDNLITGGSADDTLNGGIGADTLDGGTGTDTLTGGEGNDAYRVDSQADSLIELASEGTDTVLAVAGSYRLSQNIEELIFVGSGAFIGTGNGLSNLLRGGSGDDALDGGAGADRLEGGAGDDIYHVDELGDVVVELTGSGFDTVQTALVRYTLGENLENLAYSGAVAFTGTGNALDNVITGAGGADILNGGLGADRMVGGLANDQYYVDHVADVVVELAGEGTDAIRTSLNIYTLGDNLETLIFNGAGSFLGTGNGLSNSMLGSSGADTLAGAGGNDTLNGGAGADVLEGGAGIDTFRFEAGGTGLGALADRVTDFVSKSDKIRLVEIDANVHASGDQAFSFVGSAGFSNAAGELRFLHSGGDTWLQADVNGDGLADLEIVLSGTITPLVTDFAL